MSKLLLFLSLLSLVILALGTSFLPNYPLFQLASSSNFYQHVREILAALLFFQLVTHPPRHLIFRLLSGGVGVLVVAWVLINTYTGVMPFLDGLSLLAAAIAIGVTSLEVSSETTRKNHPEKSTSPLIA